MKKILIESLENFSEEEKEQIGEQGFQIENQLIQLTAKWTRFFLTYDPKTALRKVKCPVLALIGEKDLQVTPKENLSAIEEALKQGGNKNYTIKELPGLNHLFQTATTGLPSEYGKIEVTISPSALKVISDWILELVENCKRQ